MLFFMGISDDRNFKQMGNHQKEIAQVIHISNRTVEDHIESLMRVHGCASSKELIALFHDQP